jgi:hypothetical protein
MDQLWYADMMMHEANPTITLPMRWNGMHWAFITNIIGDDTKTGPTGNIYTHTMNYQEEPALVQITMAAEIGADGDIVEWPSLKVQSISLEPDGDGFWQLVVSTLGNTILYGADATTATSDFNAVTYASAVQRMRYKGLSLKVNAQGSDPSGQTALKVSDVNLSMSRPYVTPETLVAVSTGAEKYISEPIQDGHPEILFSWNEPTYSAIGDFDDLQDQTQKTIDFEMAETIGSDAHTLLIEMGTANPIPASVAAERGQRIPCTKNYRCIGSVGGAATGQATANPIHLVLGDLQNISYETGA